MARSSMRFGAKVLVGSVSEACRGRGPPLRLLTPRGLVPPHLMLLGNYFVFLIIVVRLLAKDPV